MIISLLNLTATNDGTSKTVSVTAKEGGAGSTEIFDFTIIDQNKTATETFGASEEKEVKVTHTASGKGFVIVTNRSSGLARHCFLNVDAPKDGC